MLWKKGRRFRRPEDEIAEYYLSRVREVDVPPVPDRLLTQAGREYERRTEAHREDDFPRGRHRNGLNRVPDIAFALFFAVSFAVVTTNIGRPSSFAAHMIARADQGRWAEILPRALDEAQKAVFSSFTGG